MKPILLMFFFLTMSLPAISASQKAHTHGIASLTLALESQVLELQLESPAANFVGFEHKARSSEEKKAVAQAEASLKDPSVLFSFLGAECQVNKIAVDMSGVVGEDHHKEHKDHHEEHKDHHEEHKDHHEEHKDHHEEHKDHHEEHEEHEGHEHSKEHHEGGHSEISASYGFSCKDPQKLTSISVKLFTQFSGLEKIDVMWITESKQGAVTLTPNKNEILLR